MATTWQLAVVSGLAILLELGSQVNSFGATPIPIDARLSESESLALQAAITADPCEKYRTRSWLRQKLIRDCDLEKYGLRLDDDWQQAPAHRLVVVLVHGFNSGPEQNAPLMKPIHEQHFACGAFVYPNDHTITASARFMSEQLKDFAVRYPERRIALVCHSMGGMVARACLENLELDPGNVERLIMIAPPTHGTLVAHFAIGSDLYEHWIARSSGGPWRRIRDSIADGLGEAAHDLCPDSEFLADLNRRPRNPRVRYSLFLGTAGCVNDAQLLWIRESLCENLAKLPGAEGQAERLDRILADLDELVQGKGDGIVAVKRGRLAGVSDTVVMPFGHLAVTGEPTDDTIRTFQREIIARVR